jgi:hypothetical protein
MDQTPAGCHGCEFLKIKITTKASRVSVQPIGANLLAGMLRTILTAKKTTFLIAIRLQRLSSSLTFLVPHQTFPNPPDWVTWSIGLIGR